MTTCLVCKGAGRVTQGGVVSGHGVREVCPKCNGTGKIPDVNPDQVTPEAMVEQKAHYNETSGIVPGKTMEIEGTITMDSAGNITDSESHIVPKVDGANDSEIGSQERAPE